MLEPPPSILGAAPLTLLSLAGVGAGLGWWTGLVQPARRAERVAEARRMAWHGTLFGRFLDAELFPESAASGGADEAASRQRLYARIVGGTLLFALPLVLAQILGSAAAGVWWLLVVACGWWAGALLPDATTQARPKPAWLAWLPLGLHAATSAAGLVAVLAAAARSSEGVTDERLTIWALFGLIGAIPVGLLVLWVTWARRLRPAGAVDDDTDAGRPFAGFETIPPAPQRAIDALLAADPGADSDPPLPDDADALFLDATGWEAAVPWDGDPGTAPARTMPPRAVFAGSQGSQSPAVPWSDDETATDAAQDAAVPWDEENDASGKAARR